MVNHTIDFYHFPGSPPSRAALLLVMALGLKHNVKMVNLMEGEQLKPDFLKLNPMHTVPTIIDGDFILWDSHVIMEYLVEKYAKDDSLYPRDVKKSAIVNQRIFFEATSLFPAFLAYCLPVLLHNKQPDPADAEKFEEKLLLLNGFLENQKFVAGENLTVADFSIISVISTAEAVMFDITKYPNVSEWYERTKLAMADFGYEKINQDGANAFGAAIKAKLNA